MVPHPSSLSSKSAATLKLQAPLLLVRKFEFNTNQELVQKPDLKQPAVKARENMARPSLDFRGC